MSIVQVDKNLFGTFLRTCRAKNGWSLCDVKQRTGINPSYLNRLERGKRRNPSVILVQSLAVAYSVQVTTLIDLLLLDKGEEQIKE
ncbi:XRE family transcriptional regulator [Neobacillus piezotolerans]|uniref:XRE family transcriptional regulator n=1 Tax=Neobacillus piezotolerans TaxID=2259171 RepID=A0A3D8GS51_9BACI|nr:helix-turn-helix transcriptional regulator [Neobacillus piezotolerans]RDU37285.1 XRE family transcriptional regulator [Neobacillus piezotolerans]